MSSGSAAAPGVVPSAGTLSWLSGPLGRLAERLVLGKYLPKLIDQRNVELIRVLAP